MADINVVRHQQEKKKKVGAKKNLAALIKLSSKTEESVIRFSLYQYIIQKFP